jgi:hypothetical protein
MLAAMTRKFLILPLSLAVTLAGCAQKAPKFPSDPVDQAATCGVIAAAGEREAAGAKGELPADAQARILHYAMLYASTGTALDPDKVNAVSKRMPALFDQTIKGDWKALESTCASTFPASQVKQPVLPAKPLDAMLQCDALAEFLRKALADQGATYGEAANAYGAFIAKLDPKMSVALRAAGLRNAEALRKKKLEELAAATKLGQPPAVIDACEKAYAG